MAKAFSVVSWNVEHFGKTSSSLSKEEKRAALARKVKDVVSLLVEQNADVMAIYEVSGKSVYSEVCDQLPDYNFQITEGPQSQEILIGVRKKFRFFFTQLSGFKSGALALRPGALLTIRVDNIDYPILFLHLKSHRDPKGFGLRDDMLHNAMKLKGTLDDNHRRRTGNADGYSNFIFMGDLNTMGMKLSYLDKQRQITGIEELGRLQQRLSNTKSDINMTILEKTYSETLWRSESSSYKTSDVDLDHVVAAKHLQFKLFDGKPVAVRGWNELEDKSAQEAWVNKYSDHALLYFEIQKVVN